MRSEVRHFAWERGAMTQVVREPREDLAPLLASPPMGFVQDRAEFSSWLEPASPVATLIINLEGRLRADGARMPDAWVTGLSDRHTIVDFAAPYRAIELKFTPSGAHAVLGWRLDELTSVIVSLEELFGAPGREFAERLHDAPDWNACFDVVEDFLAARAAASPGPSPVVARALMRLRQTDGALRIGALADELHCSRRHLGALFANEVGIAPKTMARVLRFEALSERVADAPTQWADIAAQLGFADQPHLNREVRALAGVAPSDLVARAIPGGGLVGDDVPVATWRF